MQNDKPLKWAYIPAAKAFEQAVAIDPNYAKAYVHLGTIYETLGRYSEAENSLKIAARLFRQQGMTEFAEKIEESLKSNRESDWAYETL